MAVLRPSNARNLDLHRQWPTSRYQRLSASETLLNYVIQTTGQKHSILTERKNNRKERQSGSHQDFRLFDNPIKAQIAFGKDNFKSLSFIVYGFNAFPIAFVIRAVDRPLVIALIDIRFPNVEF